MTQCTFALKKDLIIPATGNPNKGYLYFPKSLFGFSYEVRPQPKKKQLTVLLGVAELATEEIVWPLVIYEITEAGFPTTLYNNQSEYDEYIVTKSDLENQLSTLTLELDALILIKEAILDIESQEYLDAQANVDTKNSEREAKIVEIENLPIVSLQTLYTNKYEDVIGYFNGDGTLTNEGIEWAKQVKFLGEPISNYID